MKIPYLEVISKILCSKYASDLTKNRALATWPGFVRPSVCHKIHKQISKPGKYMPHQGTQECERRVTQGLN